MSILFFQRLRICCAAARDAKGSYGVYLKTSSEENLGSTPQLSPFMNQLVIAYSKKSIQKQTRTRSLKKLYIAILKICDDLDEQLKQQQQHETELSSKVNKLDATIGELRSALKDLERAWDDASKTGCLPSGIGVSTVKELKLLMDRKEKEISSLNDERNQLQNELSEIKKDWYTKSRISYDRLTVLVVSYRDRINQLYRSIEKFSNRQDALLVYYWHKLFEKLGKELGPVFYIQPLSFSELCIYRNVQLVEERSVFQAEREEINKRTSHYSNFEIKL